MINRSFDPEVFRSAFVDFPEYLEGIEPTEWVNDLKNVMYEEDGSIGLLTFNYPGVYTGHWFFKVRGKEALILAKEMLSDLFENHEAELLRGITSVTLPAARWAARQIGMSSQGIVNFPRTGPCEIFTLTKDEFQKKATN